MPHRGPRILRSFPSPQTAAGSSADAADGGGTAAAAAATAASNNNAGKAAGGGNKSPPRGRNNKASSGSGNGYNNDSNPVVASLPKRSQHPYSSIALSPDRRYAVTACKDTLQVLRIGPAGIQHLRSIPMAQHFSAPTTTAAAAPTTPTDNPGGGGGGVRDSFVLDAFGFGHHHQHRGRHGAGGNAHHGGPSGGAGASSSPMMNNVVITDVAWSPAYAAQSSSSSSSATTPSSTKQGDGATSAGTVPADAVGAGTAAAHASSHGEDPAAGAADHPKQQKSANKESSPEDGGGTSLIAAAGSNGVIVVWNAESLLEGVVASGSGAGGSRNRSAMPHAAPPSAGPEAVLSQHARAVNRLAWHPKRPGFLLSGSQDATVRLWERRRLSPEECGTAGAFAAQHQQQLPQRQAPSLRHWFGGSSGTAHYGASGTSSSGAGAAGTSHRVRPYSWHCRSKFEPKSEAVRDIRWSPFYDDVFALVTTSGSLIAYNMNVPPRAMVKMTAHSGDATTLDWHPILPDIVATGGASDRGVKIWDLECYLNLKKDEGCMAYNMNTVTSQGTEGSNETDRSTPPFGFQRGLTSSPNPTNTLNSMTASRHKSSPKALLYVLATLASVTRVRWRPPAYESFPLEREDRHGAMLAVATAPVKGASAGGAGLLALWSYHRPFMPLSVVQGHKEGAIVAFDWLDTPTAADANTASHYGATSSSPQRLGPYDKRGGHQHSILPDPGADRSGNNRMQGTSSSVHSGDALLHDYSEVDDTDKPVGIWQHVISVGRDGRCLIQSFVRGDRPISRVSPSCFSMANLSPFQKGCGSLQIFSVCQPVPSDPDSEFYLTGLRRDNVTSAAPGIFREVPSTEEAAHEKKHPSLLNRPLVQTRFPVSSPKLVFNVVDQGDLDRESRPVEQRDNERAITVAPEVVHLSRFASQYILYSNEQYPTRVSLCLHNAVVAESLMCGSLAHTWRMIATMLENTGLDELPATDDSGPVNVMSFVILPTLKALLEERADDGDVQTCVAICEVLEVITPDQTVRIPDLSISLVREWYLSYIDLLRDFCLFSNATYLIRSCKDPYVAALNQQSTTIHESCPRCGKPLPAPSATDEGAAARRTCRSCRRRVGFCFLCHEPVRGVYVWCPGCGHGGHLDHALQWFGGQSGKGVREMCPTGCGHRCNMLQQQLVSFPRTGSLREFSSTTVNDGGGRGHAFSSIEVVENWCKEVAGS